MEMMVQNSHGDIQPTFEPPLRSLLSTALSMERKLVEFLPELISETVDPILRKELEGHFEETCEHVEHVEAVFETFGQEPIGAADPLLDGLLVEHRALITETPGDQRVLTVVATAAAIEHAEIARYEVLRALAESSGNPAAVKVIVRMLDQERQALKRVCESMHRVLSRSWPQPGVVEVTSGA
jgi:ferritin-like metal-binding protein YciE